MYELIPDDKKEELNKAIQKDGRGFGATLEEIRFNIYKKLKQVRENKNHGIEGSDKSGDIWSSCW